MANDAIMSVRLPTPLLDALRRLAADRGETMSDLLRDMVTREVGPARGGPVAAPAVGEGDVCTLFWPPSSARTSGPPEVIVQWAA